MIETEMTPSDPKMIPLSKQKIINNISSKYLIFMPRGGDVINLYEGYIYYVSHSPKLPWFGQGQEAPCRSRPRSSILYPINKGR